MAAWLLGTYICPTEQSLVGAPGHKPVLSVVIVPCMSTLQVLAAMEAIHVLLTVAHTWIINVSYSVAVARFQFLCHCTQMAMCLVSLQLHSEDG